MEFGTAGPRFSRACCSLPERGKGNGFLCLFPQAYSKNYGLPRERRLRSLWCLAAQRKGMAIRMKTKLIGLGLLAAVIVAAALYAVISQNQAVTEINGYVGGEKIGLLDDDEVQDLLRSRYHLVIDYTKAGSIEMIGADLEGRDFLFPSNQTALELYEQAHGSPMRSEIVFNTPIVLYTRQEVAQAMQEIGLVREQDGVQYVDVEKLAGLIEDGVSWAEIGLPQLYGNVAVSTTDPSKSNSGNMFAGLLANALAGGVAEEEDLPDLLPRLKDVFGKLGYMESSSADLFDQFLKTGMGAKPLIAGYESQLLEFAVEEPETWEQLSSDVVMLYPVPTVWSSHVFIALDEAGSAGIDALLDEDVQRLAWEKHGFRTGVYGTPSDEAHFGVQGVALDLTQVSPMPGAGVMEEIIAALE